MLHGPKKSKNNSSHMFREIQNERNTCASFFKLTSEYTVTHESTL